MTRHLRFLPALLVLAIAGLALSACGGVPGNAVSQVDGDPIEKTDFDHWMSVFAKSGGQPGAAVPTPPAYTACVAALKKSQPKPAKGQPKVSDAQLKKQCEQQYDQLRDQAVQFLNSAAWLEGEAKERDIKLTDTEVDKKVAEFRKQPQFAAKGAYEKFLKQSGVRQSDIVLQSRNELLVDKISTQVTKGKTNVTAREVAAYYAKNKQRFSQPERRDLEVVLTKTEAKAREAKAAIEGGASFASVAKRLSIDEASKAQGGKLPGVAKGQQEKALDDAVFGAKRGVLGGPVKTQFGYYVFEVTKVTAASQQSLEQVKDTINQLLVSQKQQKLIEDFGKDFQSRWKEKTECREGYVTQGCKDAPDPTPTPSTGTTQQVPAQ